MFNAWDSTTETYDSRFGAEFSCTFVTQIQTLAVETTVFFHIDGTRR